MAIRVGSNGFGRIGRLAFRPCATRDCWARIDVVGVVDIVTDGDAVRLLARLAPERCDRFAYPKRLALRIEIERRCQPSAVAV